MADSSNRSASSFQPLSSRFLAVIAEGGSPLAQVDNGFLGKERVLAQVLCALGVKEGGQQVRAFHTSSYSACYSPAWSGYKHAAVAIVGEEWWQDEEGRGGRRTSDDINAERRRGGDPHLTGVSGSSSLLPSSSSHLQPSASVKARRETRQVLAKATAAAAADVIAAFGSANRAKLAYGVLRELCSYPSQLELLLASHQMVPNYIPVLHKLTEMIVAECGGEVGVLEMNGCICAATSKWEKCSTSTTSVFCQLARTRRGVTFSSTPVHLHDPAFSADNEEKQWMRLTGVQLYSDGGESRGGSAGDLSASILVLGQKGVTDSEMEKIIKSSVEPIQSQLRGLLWEAGEDPFHLPHDVQSVYIVNRNARQYWQMGRERSTRRTEMLAWNALSLFLTSNMEMRELHQEYEDEEVYCVHTSGTLIVVVGKFASAKEWGTKHTNTIVELVRRWEGTK